MRARTNLALLRCALLHRLGDVLQPLLTARTTTEHLPHMIKTLALLLTDTDDLAGVMQVYALEVIACVSQSSALNVIVQTLSNSATLALCLNNIIFITSLIS